MLGLFPLLVALIATAILSLLLSSVTEANALEYYRGIITGNCTFSYLDQIENRFLSNCYPRIDSIVRTVEGNLPVSVKEERILESVIPSVDMVELNDSRFWKSEVQSTTIPQEKYDNVGEPTFATNGNLIFYAGNHYAAKSVSGDEWQYIDPYYDFKGVIEANVS